MTPDELMEASPALRNWMNNMMKKKGKKDDKPSTSRRVGDVRVVQNNQQSKILNRSPVIKSPSDTTIYAPALKLNEGVSVTDAVLRQSANKGNVRPNFNHINNEHQVNQFIDQI